MSISNQFNKTSIFVCTFITITIFLVEKNQHSLKLLRKLRNKIRIFRVGLNKKSGLGKKRVQCACIGYIFYDS